MNRIKMESLNLVEQNIERLGELFPNCITEATNENGDLKKSVNLELLKQMLSDEVIEGGEFYEFTWVGKKASIVEAHRPLKNKTLLPSPEESKNWDTTENLYIEGDNLEVLKLLQKSYFGKIRMIYIDPPYNTGHDFIYPDSFIIDKNKYEEDINLYNDDGDKLFEENNLSNPRFHSDWCSIMYSRLILARNLLSEDGVIFISIDDNEQGNLRKMCDELFGIENFIASYIKQSKVGGGSDTKFVVKEHEYCIVYCKCVQSANAMFIDHDIDYLKRYKEKDENGNYFWDTFARPGLKNPIYYDITAPDGTTMNQGWIHSKERYEQEIKEGKVRIIPKAGDGWSVQFKQYLNTNGKKPRSMTMNFGGNIEGKNDIRVLFKKEKVFDYPKSVKFISTLIKTMNDSSMFVLDFFSGSATTAHAVMQLNAEDGGNRKFIMVQIQEATNKRSEAYKSGYKNICEIGKERIRRAGEKIKIDNPSVAKNLDIGFRVLRLDSTNMKDVYHGAGEFTQDLIKEMQSNIKEDRTDLDLLFSCLLEWGLPLSASYFSEKIEGYIIHTYNNGDLVVCFDKNISESLVEEIAKRHPIRAVFRDRSFADSQDKINATEIFKRFSPSTRIKFV